MTTDVLVTAVVAVPTFMDAWWNQEGTRQADGVTFALAGLSVAALLARRRWPVAVVLVCGTCLTLLYVIDHHGELLNLPTMVALYTVAVQGHRRRTILAGALASAWSGGLAMAVGSPVGSPMLEMLWPVVPLALGEVVRIRRELLAEYRARAARAEADREREAQERARTERVRIAREFHDVVAHTLAAVNVQMGVAVAAFDARPEAAREALLEARASSRQALQELRATIGLLRETSAAGDPSVPDDPGEPVDGRGPGDRGSTSPLPAPSLTEVEALAETARAAGVRVTVVADAPATGLPAAVEVAAYRIVQEALTNVIRHAAAGQATVSLARGERGFVVEVVDDGADDAAVADGPGSPAGAAGPGPPGFGIVGMQERVAALGGTFEHGPLPEGGFRVRAVLPVGRDVR